MGEADQQAYGVGPEGASPHEAPGAFGPPQPVSVPRVARRRRVVTTWLTGAFVVALAAGGAVFRPVVAPELAADGTPSAAASASGSAERPEPADQVRGETLLSESTALLRDADSVRMATDVTRGAQHVRADLRMDQDGNCVGTLDSGPANRGELIVIAGEKGAEPEAYMKFTDASLAALRAMAEQKGPEIAAKIRERTLLVRGKYVKAPAGEKGAEAIAKQCRIQQNMGPMAGDVKGTRARPAIRRKGHRVIPLVPPANAKDTGTVYVEAEGDPYIRALHMADSGMRVDIELSDYGTAVPAHRPAPSQVVELPPDDDSMFAV